MREEWKCTECETVLGVEQGPRLYLRYKQAQYVVGGTYSVIAVCRKCSALNERTHQEERGSIPQAS